MGITFKHLSGHGEGAGKHYTASPTLDTPESARKRRLEALRRAEGLWKDRTDVPSDGVEYQEQMRAEWP